jgi:hypothetical protein
MIEVLQEIEYEHNNKAVTLKPGKYRVDPLSAGWEPSTTVAYMLTPMEKPSPPLPVLAKKFDSWIEEGRVKHI